ncbi:zinc finger MYM-type 1-like [Paramuricea clavata]|uniref:Zinc finger MYM-type 1-like n=1 Tax=Paramuricea clavata TaxID=317549 RepID=A0A7D9JCJ5_PARCT|nr:zinc finger MYM-type 1-like [Paramuricea clavata]
MTSRGTKKKGKLAEHFGSKSHKVALADFYAFSQESLNVDLLLDKDKRSNAIQAEKDKLTNKDAVFILFDVARTLARQGKAFRGRSTNSTHKRDEEDGNFHQIVQLLSRHCPKLNRWLNEIRLRPYHVTYMSHDSQNEMIDILAQNIRSKMKEEVSDSKMFSLMAHTTPDTSNKDRLAVAVRYVKEDSPSFAVKERLIEVKETTDKTGNGQAGDTLTSLEDSGLKSSELLRNLSKTRWTARAESIKAVWTSLEAIVKALEEAFAAPKLDAKVKATISGLRTQAKSSSKKNLTIVDALELAKAKVTSLERINNEETEMNDMIEAALLYAKTSFQIDAKEECTRSHREQDAADIGCYRPYSPRSAGSFPRAIAEIIQKLAEMFPNEVDADVLEAELEVFRNIIDHKEELKNGSMNNIVQFAYEQRKTLPLTWKAYQLMLTAPISVAKDERTFSHLKFVKSVYRSTMVDKRLDNLILLNCEKDLTDGLDMYQVVNQWASKRIRR